MSFPSFRDWISALKLSLPAYLGVMAFPFMGWAVLAFILMIFPATGFQLDPFWLILALVSLACFMTGFAFYVLLKSLWWLLLKLLWDKPPKWLTPSADFGTTLHSFNILAVATIPLTAIFILILMTETSLEMMSEREIVYASQILPTFVVSLYWLWLLSAAYLIHWFPIKSPVDEQGQRLPIRK